MDCPPGSSVHGILQARIPEWVAIFFSRGSSQPRDQTHVSSTGRRILYHYAIWERTGVGARNLSKVTDILTGSPPPGSIWDTPLLRPLSTLVSLPDPPPHRSTLPKGESSQSVLPVFPTKTMSMGSTAEALQESKRPESAQWRPATWTQGGKWTEDWTIRRVRVPRTHSQREVLGSKCRGSASRRGQDSSPGFTWSDCLILGLASWKLVREAPLHDGLISMLKSTGKQQSPTLSTLVPCSGVLCNLRVSVANDPN